jgi:chaperonin GroES
MVNKKKKVKTVVKAKVKSKAKSKAKTPTKKVIKKAIKAKTKAPVKKVVKKVLKKKTAAVQKKQAVAPKKSTVVKLQPQLNIDYSKAITPLADRLVVRLENAERVTAGGLIIPDSVSQAVGFLKAKVLAVGVGAKNKKGALRPLDVKKGDTVLFSQHAGTKVQFNSEELQIIKESDVMGIVQN